MKTYFPTTIMKDFVDDAANIHFIDFYGRSEVFVSNDWTIKRCQTDLFYIKNPHASWIFEVWLDISAVQGPQACHKLLHFNKAFLNYFISKPSSKYCDRVSLKEFLQKTVETNACMELVVSDLWASAAFCISRWVFSNKFLSYRT